MRVGGASPPLITISAITYKVVVYAPAEAPYLYSSPICTLCSPLGSNSSNHRRESTNRLAMATLWVRFIIMVNSAQPGEGGGCTALYAHILSLYLPPRHELHRTLHPFPSKTSEIILPVRPTLPISPSLWFKPSPVAEKPIFFYKFFGGIFSIFFVQYSALLHLPPLRFHCADGCWDRTQDRCNWCIGSQTL